MKKNQFYILVGSLFVVLACVASFFLLSNPSESQYFTLKIFLGLGASAFMVALPGTISVEMNKGVHATGVFAIFIVIVFFAPEWKEKHVEPDSPALYSVIGYLKLVDNNNKPLDEPYEGITFSISPPKCGVANNGRFSVENIPLDTCNATEQIVLTISKEGYQSVNVTVEDGLPEDINPFKIKKDSTVFTVNPNGTVYLKKKLKQATIAEYNPDSTNTPIKQ
jgi:hypothetical protein